VGRRKCQSNYQLNLSAISGSSETQPRRPSGYPRSPSGHVSLVPEAEAEYLLLQVWDRLSLQYGFGQAADGVISPLPGGPAGELSSTNVGACAARWSTTQRPMTTAIRRVTAGGAPRTGR
jgi:hypothetical protein